MPTENEQGMDRNPAAPDYGTSDRRTRRGVLGAVASTAAVGLAGCLTTSPPSGDAGDSGSDLSTTQLFMSTTMYKAPSCQCCSEYASVLKSELGIDVTTKSTRNVDSDVVPAVPDELGSCHTIDADGYAIEGHVPLPAVEKLAAERPDIDGIALPGMPRGSPGMGGSKSEPFVVYAFESGGEPRVFMEV